MRFSSRDGFWPGVGSLAIAVGFLLVFATESWRWLGAFALICGLVLVMRGPAGELVAAKTSSRGCGAGHACCLPREPAGDSRGRRRRCH